MNRRADAALVAEILVTIALAVLPTLFAPTEVARLVG